MYQILFVVADSRHMDSRSKKFFESEIPQSIKRVINEVIKNLSSLSGHWYERLREAETMRQLYLNFPIDLPTTQPQPALASHPIFSKSVDFTASDQIPT